jgi:hypothetical protein
MTLTLLAALPGLSLIAAFAWHVNRDWNRRQHKAVESMVQTAYWNGVMDALDDDDDDDEEAS